MAARSLDSFDIIFHFRGQDSVAHLGEYLNCIGDINGDGFSDIAISSWEYLADGRSTYVFFGGNPPDNEVVSDHAGSRGNVNRPGGRFPGWSARLGPEPCRNSWRGAILVLTGSSPAGMFAPMMVL